MLGHLEWHDDQSKYNDRKAFDLVAGVFLSEVPVPASGPLWVRPGSHRTGHAPECAGAPCSCGCVNASPRQPILTEGVGGVVVFHRRLVHAGGPCMTSSIRYALYYRLKIDRNVLAGEGNAVFEGWESRFE